MGQYIDKDTLVAEIIHKIKVFEAFIKNFDGISDKVEKAKNKIEALGDALLFIDTLEVKEVDLEKEYKDFIKCDNGRSMFETAKHFFELGLSVNNPITATDRGTAEEIIINLKRVEQDYGIDLTKEIGWVRNKVKKGE